MTGELPSGEIPGSQADVFGGSLSGETPETPADVFKDPPSGERSKAEAKAEDVE